MRRARHLMNALRAAAFGLLTVAALTGPVGLAGPVASAMSDGCGDDCPCERGERVDGESVHVDDGCRHEPGAKGGAPEDRCPDNCPRCGCGARVALGVIQLGTTSAPLMACVSTEDVLPDGPPRVVRSGVFRPPRSLT